MEQEFTYYKHADLKKFAVRTVKEIKGETWNPDAILGLSRGGLPLGIFLSHGLNVPLIPVVLSLRDHPTNLLYKQLKNFNAQSINNILISEDIIDSGLTIKETLDVLYTFQRDYLHKFNIRVATSFFNTTNEAGVTCHYYDKLIDRNTNNSWIKFEHEL